MDEPLPPEVLDPGRLAAVERTGLLDTPPEATFDRLARLAATLLDAPYAFVTVVDARRSFWKAAIGLEPGAPRENTVRESFCQYVIQRPGRLLVDDAARDPLTRENPSIASMGVAAWAGATLRGPGGEALGSFCVVDTRPRRWTERDGEVLETLAEAAGTQVALAEALVREQAARAEATALADARGRALDRERDITDVLQGALLPSDLAAVPGVAVAARYRPADDFLQVGGDFYDLFAAHTGTWVAVVGDVCGKGTAAAAATASARWTLRSEAVNRPEAGHLLAHLNEVLHGRPRRPCEADFLSVAVAVLRRDGDGLAVELALAGHPPALVTAAGGPARLVGTTAPPVGVTEALLAPVTAFDLPAGASLVLYTDGLLDAHAPARQLEPADLAGFVGGGERRPEAIADRLMEQAVGSGHVRDDIALLVLTVD